MGVNMEKMKAELLSGLVFSGANIKISDLENLLEENAFQEFKTALTDRLGKVFDESQIQGALEEYFCILTTDNTGKILLEEMTTFAGEKLMMPLKKEAINENRLPNTIKQILENYIHLNGGNLNEYIKSTVEDSIKRTEEYLLETSTISVSEATKNALRAGTTTDKAEQTHNMETREILGDVDKGVTRDD